MTDPSCHGFRVSGYWKGWPCGATPTVKRYGKMWCKNHLPLNKAEADRLIKDREEFDPNKEWKEVTNE